jgi:hypothetical protein
MLSDLVAACERAWNDIKFVNPEIPPVMIVVGPGGKNKLGHFAPNRWAVREFDEETIVHEVLVSADYLDRKAEDIFCTLLHEAAHALNNTRALKDVSGNRHNKKFVGACLELGMIPPEKPSPSIGWSAAVLAPDTIRLYEKSITHIDEMLMANRIVKLKEDDKEPTSWKLACKCDLSFRVSKKFKESGCVPQCNLCNSDFELQE